MKRFAGKAGDLRSRVPVWSSLLWFYIRSSRLFAPVLLVLLGILWSAALFTGGYYYSQSGFERLMKGFDQMSRRYGLPYEGLTWAARLSALQRRVDVSDREVDQIKYYLHEKEEKLKELEEQLYFYRTVIAPEDSKKDIVVFSVSLRRDAGTWSYPVEVVMRNHRSKKGVVNGRVRMLVEGEDTRSGNTLVREDLLGEELGFSFRYFQRLNGVVRLPEGFNPRRLSIVVNSNRFKDVVETYAWAELLERGNGTVAVDVLRQAEQPVSVPASDADRSTPAQ